MMKAIGIVIAGTIGVPAIVLLATLVLAWETIWVDKIYQLVAPGYNWPAITYTGWFAINCIVSILCRGPRPKKVDKSWSYWLAFLLAPSIAYVALLAIMWWLKGQA